MGRSECLGALLSRTKEPGNSESASEETLRYTDQANDDEIRLGSLAVIRLEGGEHHTSVVPRLSMLIINHE